MGYVLKAVLSSAQHPEYGQITVPFPIPDEKYDRMIELLEPLEIGDALRQDCRVDELDSFYTVLNRLVGSLVNFDELDYLAKRLDSFDDGEAAQFQGMACKLGVSNIKDFINLTFCCQQATVITDFSDLDAIGRQHYMTMQGGGCRIEELERLDGRKFALDLILNHLEGRITPYGVVYDNGMKLEQLYDGRHFPCYHYQPNLLAVGLSSRQEPENTDQITWLLLPCSEQQLQRGIARSGVNIHDARIWYEDSLLPSEVEEVLEGQREDLFALNDMATAIAALSDLEQKQLTAVMEMAKPECAGEIRELAKTLELFEFAPKVRTPAEYGRYMIQDSGHYEYDPNLEEFYDYERYGKLRMEKETGAFTEKGYVAYDHAAERGGHAISFVQNFYGLTYPEAVTRLLNGEQGEVYVPAEKKEKEPPKEFALPPSNQTMRRVYAYLLQQRHISREVLSAFAQKGLIYESRELSIDQTKVYHNAVFVGFDERGVARHAHKRGLYTQGKSYRGNIEGSDPRCSFHWVGTSDRLYVFEAPLDLLAFLTLYPDGWQQHSYVALCGTAGHAMLWMLEKNPNLRKAILCLDHDAAGIEAVGRLSEVLREHGYSQIAPLQSEYKDWDEDLKARHGLEAQPAEEHPQFVAADLVCQRIGTRCKEVQPDRAAYQIPGLLLQYRNDLHWGRFDQAMEHMETMAALSLSVVLRECKQMGTALTVEQGVRFLESHILPHQNRSILKNRADEIAMQFQSVLAKNNRQGIRTQAEKKEVASAWLELAISCAKVPVKYEADEIKRRQKEEKTQRETEPVMA